MRVYDHVADFEAAATPVQRRVEDVGPLEVARRHGGDHGDPVGGADEANVALKDVSDESELGDFEGNSCNCVSL